MKFGFVITSGVMSQSTRSALALAGAAMDRGIEVEIFLMGDGIYVAKAGPKVAVANDLADLVARGARISLCALNAQQRGVGEEEAVEGVLFGSQYDAAQLVAQADRVLYFGDRGSGAGDRG